MNNIPKKAKEILRNEKCVSCGTKITKSSIIAMGIRQSKVQKDMTVFFVEHMCLKCKKVTLIELYQTGLEDMIMDFVDEFVDDHSKATEEKTDKQKSESDNVPKKKKPKTAKIKTSKISKREMDNCIKDLNQAEFQEDWLAKLGFSSEQISSIQQKGRAESYRRRSSENNS
jgi:predicted nucleic-acid-binding Zn-ribbon protein